jgi:DNA-binding CsgD family transcriptional regulator
MFDELSRHDLLQLMELASRCLTATTVQHLEAIISSVYNVASFRKVALCALSVSETEVALTDYVNHSYGAEWAELYAGQDFQRVDPVLLHATSTEGAFRWDDALASRGSHAAFFEAAEAFGLVDGLSFSCAGIAAPAPKPTVSPAARQVITLPAKAVIEIAAPSDGAIVPVARPIPAAVPRAVTSPTPTFRSVLSLTGVPLGELERIQRVLGIIGPHLHESYRRVLQMRPEPVREPEPEPARPPRALAAGDVELSAREREVLCWAQQGKTYWEIGCILGISQRTVKFHIARIKVKLDVVSTAHAIAKAMRAGVIS